MLPDTVTAAEMAALMGVRTSTVDRWAKSPTFPAPAGRRPRPGPGGGPRAWETTAVAAWFGAIDYALDERDRRAGEGEQAAAAVALAERERIVEARRRAVDLLREGLTADAVADRTGLTYHQVRGVSRRAAPGGTSPRRGRSRRYDADACIDALRRCADTIEGPLSFPAYTAWRYLQPDDTPSGQVVARRLGAGSWAEAVAACGITPHTRRHFAAEPAERAVRQAIKASRARTTSEYERWRDDHPEAPSLTTVYSRFGSWPAAVRAAHR